MIFQLKQSLMDILEKYPWRIIDMLKVLASEISE